MNPLTGMPKHVSGEVEVEKSRAPKQLNRNIIIKISPERMVTCGDRVKERRKRQIEDSYHSSFSEKRCQTVSFHKIPLVIQIMHQGITYRYIHMGLIL